MQPELALGDGDEHLPARRGSNAALELSPPRLQGQPLLPELSDSPGRVEPGRLAGRDGE